MIRTLPLLLAVLHFLSPSTAAQCGSAGLLGTPRITLSGKAVDRMIEFRLDQGHPGSDWVCFLDSNPGPTPTPFGTLCVTPAAVDIFNTFAGTAPLLDASGSARIPVFLPPALGALDGIPFYFQAVIADPTTPNGISISENRTHAFRRPRVFVSSTLTGSDSFALVDPSTGTSDFTNSNFNPVREILPIPSENLVAVLKGNNFSLLDDETGATVFNETQSAINHMALARDGRTLILHVLGPILFIPGSVRTLDIPTLAQQDFPLTTANIFPTNIFAHPEQDVVYLANSDTIHRMDYTTGALLPSIATGQAAGSRAHLVHDENTQTLYVTAEGFINPPPFPLPLFGGVSAIDLTTDSLLGSSGSFPVIDIPLGPAFPAVGTNGPGIFVPVQGRVREVDPSTFLIIRSIEDTGTAALSSGGTELLFLDSTSLRRFDLSTDTFSVVATTTDVLSNIATAPGRAFYIDDDNLYGFDTDPASAPTLLTPLFPGQTVNSFSFLLAAE